MELLKKMDPGWDRRHARTPIVILQDHFLNVIYSRFKTFMNGNHQKMAVCNGAINKKIDIALPPSHIDYQQDGSYIYIHSLIHKIPFFRDLI